MDCLAPGIFDVECGFEMVSTFVQLCAGESGFLTGNRLDVCHKFLFGEFLTCGALIDCLALLNSGNKPKTYRTLGLEDIHTKKEAAADYLTSSRPSLAEDLPYPYWS